MSKPALTLNEPTATGWLRMELYGNKDLAVKYTQAARTLLGSLRSIHSVNQRIAEGEAGGFFHQWSTLADGTEIHAISNDGQDTLRIYANATAASSRRVEPLPTVRAGELIAVGINQGQYAGQTLAFLWTEATGTVELPPLPNCIYAIAYAISGDGQTIVGRCSDANGLAYAVRWDRQGNVTDMGIAGGYVAATGVSFDGSVIVGYRPNATGQDVLAWRWTEPSGVVDLAGSSFRVRIDFIDPYSDNPSNAVDSGPLGFYESDFLIEAYPQVSSSGTVVAAPARSVGEIFRFQATFSGGPSLPYLMPGVTAHPVTALWRDERPERGNSPQPQFLPNAAPDYTLHSKSSIDPSVSTFPDQSITFGPVDNTLPTSVADDGSMTANYGNKVGIAWSELDGYVNFSPFVTDSLILVYETSFAQCITPDGTVAGGYDVDADGIVMGWWWDRKTGKHRMMHGVVMAISADASILGGGGGPDADNFNFVPVLWDQNGNETYLDLLPDYSFGQVNSLSVASSIPQTGLTENTDGTTGFDPVQIDPTSF